jgi:hypothetical protein
MKPRHAAALALVGWYLMVPPLVGTPPNQVSVNLGAPLSEWETYDSYDSAADCHNAALEQLAISEHVSAHHNCDTENTCETLQTQTKLAKCIATDDPRLKGDK